MIAVNDNNWLAYPTGSAQSTSTYAAANKDNTYPTVCGNTLTYDSSWIKFRLGISIFHSAETTQIG